MQIRNGNGTFQGRVQFLVPAPQSSIGTVGRRDGQRAVGARSSATPTA